MAEIRGGFKKIKKKQKEKNRGVGDNSKRIIMKSGKS